MELLYKCEHLTSMPLVLTTVCFCAPKSRLFNLGYGSYGNAGASYREHGSRVRPSSVCEPPSLATTTVHTAQSPAAPQYTDVSLTPLCLSSLFLLPSSRPRLPINLADTVSLNRGGTVGKPPQEQQRSVALWKERLVLSLTELPVKCHAYISRLY